MSDLQETVRYAHRCLLSEGVSGKKALSLLYTTLCHVSTESLHPVTGEDFAYALNALRLAIIDDLSGVAAQYLRLVSTAEEVPDTERVFFTLWHRTKIDPVEPFFCVCRINQRNLDLLRVTRSVPFVETLVNRLRASSYPKAILASRVQGVEMVVGAGVCPRVLFADFVEMGNHAIDAATSGGLLFDTFGNELLEPQMKQVERAFPSVAKWLAEKGVLNKESIHLLTTAHVQTHDLCGHCIPYDLVHPTRLQVGWFMRAPLEEYYADTQAMWAFSNAALRPLLRNVLTDNEIDAVPVLIAMKRLAFYATLDAEDHDARCAWMFFGYWRKAGLIRSCRTVCDAFSFDLEGLPIVVEQMLDELLEIEYAIGDGVEKYDQACRAFSDRYGYENPVTKKWDVPDDLYAALGYYDASKKPS